MRISQVSDLNGALAAPYGVSNRHFTGPNAFDESNTVTARIIKLSFWLAGIIFISTSVLW